MAEKTAKGAEEFVRYFWAVYDYSYATGDATARQAISGKECAFCEGAIKEVTKTQAQRLRQLGGEIKPLAIRAAPGPVKASVVVISVVNQASSKIIDTGGSVVTTSKALTAAKLDARIDWNSGAWIVGAVTVETNGR